MLAKVVAFFGNPEALLVAGVLLAASAGGKSLLIAELVRPRRCERVVSGRTTRLPIKVCSGPRTDVPSGHGAVLPRRRPQARRQPEHSGRRIEVITWSIVSSGLRC